MLLVGVLLYYFILPARYNKVISFIDWLFSGTDNIIATLRSADIVIGQLYKIILTKVVLWLWGLGFIFSIFLCGKAIQNKEEPNLNARYIGRVGIVPINNAMSAIRIKIENNSSQNLNNIYGILKRVENRIQALNEFGFADNQVLEIEGIIYEKLQNILSLCDSDEAENEEATIRKLANEIMVLCEKREMLLKKR